jgi:hypothetical protein
MIARQEILVGAVQEQRAVEIVDEYGHREVLPNRVHDGTRHRDFDLRQKFEEIGLAFALEGFAQYPFPELVGEMIGVLDRRDGATFLKHDGAGQDPPLERGGRRDRLSGEHPLEQAVVLGFQLSELLLENGVLGVEIVARALDLIGAVSTMRPDLRLYSPTCRSLTERKRRRYFRGTK